MLVLTLLACDPSTPAPVSPSVAPAPTVEQPTPPNADDVAAAYRIRFPEAAAHRIHVEATAPCPAEGAITWWMPTWTPGSYLIREYARNVEELFELTPEGRTPALKIAKNRWRIPCTSPGEASISYRVYAREMSVRTSFVDEEFGVLNSASLFVLPDGVDGPLDVQFDLPAGWSRSETALPLHPSGDAHRYWVPDVDTLIDAPILLGNPDVRTFDVEGVEHHVVTLGASGPWNHQQALADIQKITKTQVQFWGDIPYPHYRFLVVLAERGGGLEHLNSTLMMTSRFNQLRRADRMRWLGLVSHEFFHTWNVKRLRPQGLGPFDYENEVYTPSLWVAEGITSYYDDLMLVRAGLMTEKEYLDRLSRSIADVRNRPGRLVQSLGDASFDAWIKYYRKDENSSNTQVSYYSKGAVVAWMLDAEIRRATSGRVTLDDLMRQASARFSDEGFSPEAFRDLASEVAGSDLGPFFEATVDSAEPLDLGGALQWWGLRFAPTEASSGDDPTPGSLGATTKEQSGRLMVTQVLRDSAGWHAGLNVDDEVIALDGFRLTSSVLTERLAQLGAGYQGELLVSRRGRLVPLTITLAGPPQNTWTVQVDPGASPIAARRRAKWLGIAN